MFAFHTLLYNLLGDVRNKIIVAIDDVLCMHHIMSNFVFTSALHML